MLYLWSNSAMYSGKYFRLTWWWVPSIDRLVLPKNVKEPLSEVNAIIKLIEDEIRKHSP